MRRIIGGDPKGVSVTITSTPSAPADLQDMFPRVKDMKAVWSALEIRMTETPSTFSKPSRFINDRMPVGLKKGERGARPPDGSGYGGGYHGRLKLNKSKRRAAITSNRPYAPSLRPEFLDGPLLDALENWFLEGDPNP
jgi:hypothetical protein